MCVCVRSFEYVVRIERVNCTRCGWDTFNFLMRDVCSHAEHGNKNTHAAIRTGRAVSHTCVRACVRVQLIRFSPQDTHTPMCCLHSIAGGMWAVFLFNLLISADTNCDTQHTTHKMVRRFHCNVTASNTSVVVVFLHLHILLVWPDDDMCGTGLRRIAARCGYACVWTISLITSLMERVPPNQHRGRVGVAMHVGVP